MPPFLAYDARQGHTNLSDYRDDLTNWDDGQPSGVVSNRVSARTARQQRHIAKRSAQRAAKRAAQGVRHERQ